MLNEHHVTPCCGCVSSPAGDQVRVLDYNKTREWAEVKNQSGLVGWVPNNHIAPVNSLDKFSWSVQLQQHHCCSVRVTAAKVM